MSLGRPGVGYAAQEQVAAYHKLGCDVSVFAASSHAILPPDVSVHTTLQVGRIRLPLRVIGMDRGLALHDRIVARAIEKINIEFDVVHTWPGCSERTLRSARRTGALAVREAPNTHTDNAYSVVEREHERLGVPLSGSHARNPARLRRELREYEAADLILAPSELAIETFVARGVPASKLALKAYGFDPKRFAMDPERQRGELVTFTFIGRCEPRKGLHLALEAWKKSGVAETTRFVILGEFAPGYRKILAGDLEHPNIEMCGFVPDLRPVYAATDVLVLPSIEEGSSLVTYDAQGAGCALLVSRAAGARMTPGVEGLVHEPGDVETLAEQMRELATDAGTRACMQRAAHRNAPTLTWDNATRELLATFEAFRHRQAATSG
jgi:glycosyltransferase involved in cell wall biosynthesis